MCLHACVVQCVGTRNSRLVPKVAKTTGYYRYRGQLVHLRAVIKLMEGDDNAM